MNVDEIKAKTARLRELVKRDPETDPAAAEGVEIALDLLEGFLINMSNATYFLENIDHMKQQERQ